ncbi:uncharacterized protein LOC122274350 [Carya illinoinensis]|uniref:uncharacterized protein LOC122274350 n=1 Tax=Carya illinoinensis TaxID=32201 RepID=UPI001C72437A|nr:uncharacterized protein LOC122274350 [Carya illinoinensis]
MEEDITQRRCNLNLTEEEQQEFHLQEDAVMATKLRGNHCLLAMVFNDRYANSEAFKSTMSKVWNIEGWLSFRDLGSNKFLLEFELNSDKETVLQGRPWSFDRHLISLKEFEGVLTPNEVQFNTELFWVQIHNLPFAGMNEMVGRRIGETIRRVHLVEVDD